MPRLYNETLPNNVLPGHRQVGGRNGHACCPKRRIISLVIVRRKTVELPTRVTDCKRRRDLNASPRLPVCRPSVGDAHFDPPALRRRESTIGGSVR